ncbi:MAG: LuxR C-terminal-related transcriptional regulator [Catenulispora sp.]
MRQPVQTLLEHTRGGRGGVLLLGGATPAELAAVAEPQYRLDGFRVLRAAGFRAEAALAFAGLADLVRPLGRGGAGNGSEFDVAAGGPYRLGAAAGELVARAAAEGPVLALIADAHWLDPESAAAIAVAVRVTQREQAPVAWLLGVDDVRRGPFGTLGAVTVPLPRRATPAAELPTATRRALLVLAASATGHVDEVGGALERLGLHVGDLAPAVAEGLLEATGSGWRFRDHGVATTVYGAATPAERRATHAAFVEAIFQLRSAEKGEVLARHLAGAASTTDPAAAEALGRAADGARLRGALEAARSAYGRAASLSPDSAARARWLAGAADSSRLLGDLAGVGRAIREARILTDDPAVHQRLDRIAARTSAVRTVQPDIKSLLEPGSPAATIGLIGAGRAAEAEAMVGPLVSAALLADPLDMGPLTLPAIAAGAMWTGDGGGAAAVLDRSIALLRAYGAGEHLPALLIVRAEAGFRLGHWPTARDDAEEAAALASQLGQQPLRAVARGLALRVSSLMGAPTEPASALEAESLGAEAYAMWSRHAIGTAHLAHGRWREAATALAGVADGLERLGVREPSVLPVAGDLVEAALRIGELARARKTAQRAQELAAGSTSTVARAVAERCLGQVGEARSAKSCFEAALRLHAETGDRYEEARTLLVYARMDGDRARLEAAADRFAALGAWPWLARVEAELAGGAKPGDDTLAVLTAQELRVARLAAGGATNDEAAAALGISPRTVEQHLGVVYSKLHIRRRAELARLFPDL